MEENKEQLQRLRDYLAQTQGMRYPFQGHRLENEENYMKNLYLKHLCLVVEAGRSIDEMQSLFLQRLIAGCGAEYDRGTYMRQGGDATEESLEELFEQLNQRGLREAFLLDAVLAVHLGEEYSEQDEFVAALCTAMGIRPDEMERLARLCAGILRLDLQQCLDLDLAESAGGTGGMWVPYLPEGLPPAWKDIGDRLYVGGTSLIRFDLGRLGDVRPVAGNSNMFSIVESTNYNGMDCIHFENRTKVTLCNLELFLDKHIRFSNVSEVEFVGCFFLGDGKKLSEAASLWFEKCPQVSFKKCTFKDFGGRVMYTIGGRDIFIEDSSFVDCVVKYSYGSDDWREFGAIVCSRWNHGEPNLILKRDHFMNCGGINNDYYFVSSILSNCKASIYGCEIKHCWHWHFSRGAQGIDPDENRRCLFKHVVEQSSNEIIDSAKLGY